MNVPTIPLRGEDWNGLDRPHLVIALVKDEDARAWHRGELSDSELFVRSLRPDQTSGAGLFVKKINGAVSWRALGRILAGLKPPVLLMPAFHPVILRRIEEFGSVAGFEVSPGLRRYLIEGDDLTRFIEHFP